MNKHKVTIIVPVYGDWLSLKDCIESLKVNVDPVHHVMLVNDCGPEVDVIETNIKAAIKNQSNFNYWRNPKNLGFVGTCNRAVLKLDKTDNDIVLLNSDTKVTEGWLDEMLAVMYDNQKIGAVSPRSNNATICTFPISAMRDHGLKPDQSYKLWQKYHDRFPSYSSAPTAHGFCILIRRTLINKYGLFDPVYGKGYGEEVDFCQRLAKQGWHSVISHHAFVFHLEARSFSLVAKAKMIEANSQIVSKRFPNYKQAVNDYIQKVTAEESKIFGRDNSQLSTSAKNLIKHNKKLHSLARAIKSRLKN